MQTLFLLIDCRKFTGIDVEKGSHLPIDCRKFSGLIFGLTLLLEVGQERF